MEKDKTKLKETFAAFSKAVKELFAEPLKMVSAKLVDGTSVEAEGETLTEGTILYVITEEGKVEAPAGEHQLEDGTIVVVSEGGKIESVTTKPVEVEDKKDEEMKAVKGEIDSLKSQLAEVLSKFSAQTVELEKSKEAISKMYDVVKELSELPASEPVVEPTQTTLRAQSVDRVSEIKVALEKIKNKK